MTLAMEKTLNAVKDLNDEQAEKVYFFVLGMKAESDIESQKNPFAPKSEQDILDDLSLARKHADAGMCRDMNEALDDIGAKYGFI